jgi:hypothetical protein
MGHVQVQIGKLRDYVKVCCYEKTTRKIVHANIEDRLENKTVKLTN